MLFRTPNYSNQFTKKDRYNLKGRLSYRTLEIKLWSQDKGISYKKVFYDSS